VDGEAAAVCGIVGVGEVVAVAEGALVEFEGEADGVGAAVEAGDDVDLSLDPTLVVGRGAGECGVEERLVGLAEAADVDDDGLLAGEGELAEAEAETPGGVVVEAGEEEFGFLAGDGGEVFGDGHGERFLRKGRVSGAWMAGGQWRGRRLGLRVLRNRSALAALTLPFGYAMLRG
jgi:hypothetical protein